MKIYIIQQMYILWVVFPLFRSEKIYKKSKPTDLLASLSAARLCISESIPDVKVPNITKKNTQKISYISLIIKRKYRENTKHSQQHLFHLPLLYCDDWSLISFWRLFTSFSARIFSIFISIRSCKSIWGT